MSGYVGSKKPARVVLITECSMADNVSVHHPDVQFVRPCNLCPHMKRITLANIRTALEEMRYEVTIDPAVAGRLRLAVERMLAVQFVLVTSLSSWARSPRKRRERALPAHRRMTCTILPTTSPAIMVEPSLHAALLEDLGRAGDLTNDRWCPRARATR